MIDKSEMNQEEMDEYLERSDNPLKLSKTGCIIKKGTACRHWYDIRILQKRHIRARE